MYANLYRHLQEIQVFIAASIVKIRWLKLLHSINMLLTSTHTNNTYFVMSIKSWLDKRGCVKNLN